jgi:hypothetical protein
VTVRKLYPGPGLLSAEVVWPQHCLEDALAYRG